MANIAEPRIAALAGTGAVQMVTATNALGPFTYINGLKIDSLGRIVVVMV